MAKFGLSQPLRRIEDPRLLKGGLVQIDPVSGAVLGVIALQYNPDTLSRTLQAQSVGAEGGAEQDHGDAV